MPTGCPAGPGTNREGEERVTPSRLFAKKFVQNLFKSKMILARTLKIFTLPCSSKFRYLQEIMYSTYPTPRILHGRKVRPRAKKTQLDGEKSEMTTWFC